MTDRALSRANHLLFIALVVILLAIGVLTWDRFAATKSARLWSQHTYEVIDTLKDLQIGIRDAETGQRGYLLTGDDEYLTPYETALRRVTFLQGTLQRLTADNPAQQERLRTLSPVLQAKLEELAQTIQLRRTDGLPAALKIVETNAGRRFQVRMESILGDMTAEEQGLLAQRLAATDNRGTWVRWLVAAGGAISILAIVLAIRTLNRAWATSASAEAEHRSLSLRLRASLDSLSQGVGVFDAERRLTHFNGCFQALLAIPRGLVRPGTSYAALSEQSEELGTGFLETEAQIRHGRSSPGEAVTYERTLPEGHQLELRRTPMPDGGFVLTVTDMTKRALAEAVLREAQKMQAIGQLTGGIAHDFNNMLTVILGNMDFVRSRLDSMPELQKRLERAVSAAQRGAALTGQLLAFARKQPLAPAAIDLADTLPDLVPLLRRTLGEHIDVRYVESAGLWQAMADPAQLESALLNLALNARDAMPGGGRLTIELANKVLDEDYAHSHAEVAAGDYTMLAVSDTGFGMTPDILARVFEPFFTTKTDGKGTGLGLAMVFGFVKQSGGHVKVYSEPGEGTTVRIYLPRAVGQSAVQLGRTNAPMDLPQGSATILVVEDEPAVREIAVEMLADLGYRVLEAADGEEALRVFGAHAAEVDMLLTDVVLPGGLRGREIAERVTAIRPDVRVLFMSGYTENSIVHNGRLDDGVHLLGKPFKREELARKVAKVLVLEGVAPEAIGKGEGSNVVPFKSRWDT